MSTAPPTLTPLETQATRHCPQCSGPMTPLQLASRSARAVVVDHCTPCRLVWFDPLESVNLAGLGWVSLLRTLQQGTATAPPPARGRLQCPVCQSPLKAVRNQTRFGRFPALECAIGHGHLHSQAGLLAERGLVRPLLPLDRRTLAEEGRTLACLHCGAQASGPGDARADTCSYCDSPLLVIDLPRLAHALTVQSAEADAGPAPSGVPLAWPCRGCGSPLDPGTQTTCPACGHGVVVPALGDLAPLLDHLEAQLQPLPPRRAPQHRPARQRSFRDTSLWSAQDLFKDDSAADKPAAWRWIAAVALLGLIWLFTTGAAFAAPPGRAEDGSAAARALAAQAIGPDAAGAWHWREATAALRGDDEAEALDRGLLDNHLAAAAGQALAPTTPLATLLASGQSRPPIAEDRPTRQRWRDLLQAQLRPAWPAGSVPIPPELESLAPRMREHAPGLWSSVLADGQPRSALWALTVQHQGPVPLAPGELVATLRPTTALPIDFDCAPPRGRPWGLLRPGQSTDLVCRSRRPLPATDVGLLDAAARLARRDLTVVAFDSRDLDDAQALRRMGERLAATVPSPVPAFLARFAGCESRGACAPAAPAVPAAKPDPARTAAEPAAANVPTSPAEDRPPRARWSLGLLPLILLGLGAVYMLLAWLVSNRHAATIAAVGGFYLVPNLLAMFIRPGAGRQLIGAVPDAPSFAGLFVLLLYFGAYMVAWFLFVGLLWLLYRLLFAGRA